MKRHFRYDAELGKVIEFLPNEKDLSTILAIQKNIGYISPATGEKITTWAKRDYDMKVSGCCPSEEGKERAIDGKRNRKGLCDGLTLRDIQQH